MDSLASVSPPVVLPPRSALRHRRWLMFFPSSCPKHQRRLPSFSSLSCSLKPSSSSSRAIFCKFSSTGKSEDEEERRDDDEVEKALQLDGTIPVTSNEFLQQVSSRAYDMRRHLQQSFDSSSYDVLEANPWRESSKAVYVLTRRENQLCTMKTRRNISEVETELGKLFSNGGKWRKPAKKSEAGTAFQMLVEDIRDGVLVFEDENEAAKYCDLLQGGGKGCEGVAEIEASSVFDLCRKMRALAVLFRRGRAHPLPESLELNLRARKRSLEDQNDAI